MNPLTHLYLRLEHRDDRGDVPGWALVTVMTAWLGAALYGIANDQLSRLLTDALSSVRWRVVRSSRSCRGAAVVDFVLVVGVLLPVVLGVLQLALVLFVRNTLASGASEGGR